MMLVQVGRLVQGTLSVTQPVAFKHEQFEGPGRYLLSIVAWTQNNRVNGSIDWSTHFLRRQIRKENYHSNI